MALRILALMMITCAGMALVVFGILLREVAEAVTSLLASDMALPALVIGLLALFAFASRHNN